MSSPTICRLGVGDRHNVYSRDRLSRSSTCTSYPYSLWVTGCDKDTWEARGMETASRTIETWFSSIETGEVMLPRFQRHESWRQSQIVNLFENILRKPALPIGVLLILQVGSKEQFYSRPIVSAPKSKDRVTMHLLDGQQRMTALWRTLTGSYSDFAAFVSLEPREEPDDDEPESVDARSRLSRPQIERVKRWDRKGVRQPVWADKPDECYKRRLVPLTCLRPGRKGEDDLSRWLAEVQKDFSIPSADQVRIHELRQRVAGYLIPHLSLESTTSKTTALDVFINMNTSSSPLKDYDIVVAQLEGASGESLHQKVEEFLDEQPVARNFGRIEDVILSVSALLSDRPPIKKTYLDKEFGATLADNWEKLLSGFRRGLAFLQEEAIFNEKCLPTDIAVYLVCALMANVPENDFDREGNARSLIRKALWRTCYTSRYSKTSATRSYADYQALTVLLRDPSSDVRCELFDQESYPLPDVDQLRQAGWPRRKDRLPRAILATAHRGGGYDFADGTPATVDNLGKREYHHIFPVDVLSVDRKDELVNRAMNCALITWRTNRKLAAKTPREQIERRTQAARLGEEEVRQRLNSHLIPIKELWENDYHNFIHARAQLIHKRMVQLCNGEIPS